MRAMRLELCVSGDLLLGLPEPDPAEFAQTPAKGTTPGVWTPGNAAFTGGCSDRRCWWAQPTQARALRNMRSQGLGWLRSPVVQESCAFRATRSGCGIIAVNRPSLVVTAVRPSGEPFGVAG